VCGGCRSQQSHLVAVIEALADAEAFLPSERGTFSDRLLPAVIWLQKPPGRCKSRSGGANTYKPNTAYQPERISKPVCLARPLEVVCHCCMLLCLIAVERTIKKCSLLSLACFVMRCSEQQREQLCCRMDRLGHAPAMRVTLCRVPCREQWSAGTTPNSTAVLPRTRSRQRSVPCVPVVASDTRSCMWQTLLHSSASSPDKPQA